MRHRSRKCGPVNFQMGRHSGAIRKGVEYR